MQQDAQPVSRDSVVVRDPQLPASRVDQDVVILNIATGRYSGLDEVGRRIWEAIESPVRVGALCDRLASQYRGDPLVIEQDVIRFLGQLRDESLIRVEG